MVTKSFIVRIIKPKDKPVCPKLEADPLVRSEEKNRCFLTKIINISKGSGIGIFIGLLVYLMLRSLGIDSSGIESALIIGLPSFLGVVTSLVMF